MAMILTYSINYGLLAGIGSFAITESVFRALLGEILTREVKLIPATDNNMIEVKVNKGPIGGDEENIVAEHANIPPH